MKFNLFKKKYPKIAACWNKGKDERFPEGENTNDVIKRVNKFLLSLKKYKDKKKILLISHSFFKGFDWSSPKLQFEKNI